jgi:protein-L-isoaspartate(D-aspartate) O-methyltransferase
MPTLLPMTVPINLQAAREQMIEQQVRAWDVLDQRVLQTMLQVKREEFAPLRYRDVAFADSPLPLARGQTMLPANVHGRILQALEIDPGDVALEVGAGSGYLSACLGKLASRVRTLEIFPELAEQARLNLLAARINNVAVEVADGMRLNEQSSYDVIAVTGSLPIYDERFQQALRIGGRLFVVVGQPPIMEAWRVVRVGEREWQRQALFETVVEPLVNAPRPSAFVF